MMRNALVVGATLCSTVVVFAQSATPDDFAMRIEPALSVLQGVRGGGVSESVELLVLSYLFRRGSTPACEAAADFNGDGGLNAADAVGVFYWLFREGAPPALGLACGTFESPLRCRAQIPCE